jgi:Tfp pilus assembly protein PilF
MAGAADAYERAMYINPFDPEVHAHLADLYQKLGNKSGVVRERRVIVGLNTVDMAGAYYRLAVAQDDAGDQVAARRSVVRALEVAPNYVEAQALLLKLHGGSEEQPR